MPITEAVRKNILRKKPWIDQIRMVNGIPLFSWVELNVNELCNRTCAFCPRHDPKVYPNQNLHMDLELAEVIASQLCSVGFKGTVNISGTGEPTLTKHLPDIVSRLSDRGIRVDVVTNGDRLKPKIVKDLYLAGLSQLVVSMYDGPEQIKYFSSLLRDCGIDEELFTLRDRWYGEDEDYGLIYTNRAGSLGEKLASPKKRPCFYPYYALYIDWNGDVLLCCQDSYRRTEKFGNVKNRVILPH